MALPRVPVPAVDLLKRLDALGNENKLLGRELLRCYDQLSLVFDVTAHLATLDEPQGVEAVLVRRWGALLGVPAVYEDDSQSCALVPVSDAPTTVPLPDPTTVRAALAEPIACVRTQRRTQRLPTVLDGAHVLLSALTGTHDQSLVLVAIRPATASPFDDRDVLASESVLGYGGQVLANIVMARRLRDAAFESVRALVNAIDAKDRYTCGHSERVGYLARLLGQSLRLPEVDLITLEWAGLLHDVGKIGIPESLLHKAGRLTPDEYEIIKRHPRLSHDVLKPVAALAPLLPAVLHHHENWDGKGYPQGLAGSEVPLAARIIHVVDIFDALTSTRAYRAGHSLATALNILRSGAGRVTDPELTAVFEASLEHLMRVQPAALTPRFAHVMQHASPAPPAGGALGIAGNRTPYSGEATT